MRYRVIDRERAAKLLGYASVEDLAAGQRDWAATWQEAHPGREIEWSESGEHCGYDSVYSFSRAFKSIRGESPSAYRHRYQG